MGKLSREHIKHWIDANAGLELNGIITGYRVSSRRSKIDLLGKDRLVIELDSGNFHSVGVLKHINLVNIGRADINKRRHRVDWKF